MRVSKKMFGLKLILDSSLNLVYASSIEDIVYSRITLSLLKMKPGFLQMDLYYAV